MRVVLVFIMLWLPAQTFAIVGMLYCDHHLHSHVPHQGPGPDQHQHPADHGHADHDLAKKSSLCEQCSLCQNCSFSTLPSAVVAGPPDFVFSFQDARPSSFQPFFPERLQRPPCLINA